MKHGKEKRRRSNKDPRQSFFNTTSKERRHTEIGLNYIGKRKVWKQTERWPRDSDILKQQEQSRGEKREIFSVKRKNEKIPKCVQEHWISGECCSQKRNEAL